MRRKDKKITVIKRIFDLSLTLPGIMLISPVILFTALLVRIKIGRPFFFIQERPGLYSRPFRMYKFRTMTDERDGNLFPDEENLVLFD